MKARVSLRNVRLDDLPIFFEQQKDPTANQMAAFTSKDPADRAVFLDRWEELLDDDTVTKRTILLDGKVAGHVEKFQRNAKPEVSYWLGREYWGKGIATEALHSFLEEIDERPLYARAASDNVASIRVLEKCGFEIRARERAFANARGEEIEEVVMELAR